MLEYFVKEIRGHYFGSVILFSSTGGNKIKRLGGKGSLFVVSRSGEYRDFRLEHSGSGPSLEYELRLQT